MEISKPMQTILKRVGLLQTQAAEWRKGVPVIAKSQRKSQNTPTWILRSLLEFNAIA
jgi:hypothetical protein